METQLTDLPQDVIGLIVHMIPYHLLLPLSFVKVFRRKTLIRHGPFSSMSMNHSVNEAARNGHINIVRWCIEKLKYKLQVSNCAEAASGGQLEMLKWLHERSAPRNSLSFAYAAKGGHSDVIKWLTVITDPPFPWGHLTTEYAAMYGHLDILKWVISRGCPWDAWIWISAARSGYVHILSWIADNLRKPELWGVITCAFAALEGHLDTLKWLRSKGAPWNQSTCLFAARHGHLDILKWAREGDESGREGLSHKPGREGPSARSLGTFEPCPWNSYVISGAKTQEIADWARDHGCPEID